MASTSTTVPPAPDTIMSPVGRDDRVVHHAQCGHRQRGHRETCQQGRGEPPAGGHPIDQRGREDAAGPERSEQVPIAPSFGAEPLVGDEHQQDRLRPVDERDTEQEPGEHPRSGRASDGSHSLEEVGSEGAWLPGGAARLPASVEPLQPERRAAARGGQEGQGVDREREHR